MKETVVVIDAGGRGCVQVEKYAQNPSVKTLAAIPGNDWILNKTTSKEVLTFPSVKITDTTFITQFCKNTKPSLVVVSQDNSIAAGQVDFLQNIGITVLGPTKKAARIEWDKAYARQLLSKLDLPQPRFDIFHNPFAGINFVLNRPDQKYFIKASGLCEGKGAIPAKNQQQAVEAIERMKNFGPASKTFLVEDWLENDDKTAGEEFSAFALSDGKNFKLLGTAKDFKRVYNFDEGENTGGMASIAPHPRLTNKDIENIEVIFDKTISALRKNHRSYRGVLYLGGMIVEKSGIRTPYIIEFNARWGDPEAQAILPGIKNDLYELSLEAAKGSIKNLKIETDSMARVVIAGVTRGYPGTYSDYTGKQIFGIDSAKKIPGINFYGGGIKIVDGDYFTPKKPSRLFYVVGEGENTWQARTKAYDALKEIKIPEIGLHYRTDIF